MSKCPHIPKISIVTINYNNKSGLEKTIQSIVDQTKPPYEWIIIDGGSEDGSVEVIERYSDHITSWVSEPDKGIFNAMNKGLDKVSGDYVQFLNSGDTLCAKDVLEKVSISLGTHCVDYWVGREILSGDFFSEVIPPRDITGDFLFSYFLPHPASFVRFSLLNRIHFDETYEISSDWIFSVQALLLNNASYYASDIIVADFDMHGVSTTRKWDADVERERAWKQLFGERIYDDYVRLTSGKTILEKIVCRVAKFKDLYALLTMLALPVFAIYKIRKHFIR